MQGFATIDNRHLIVGVNIGIYTDLKKYCLIFFVLTLCGYSFSSQRTEFLIRVYKSLHVYF